MGPEFWVAISFVMFVGLLLYLGLPGKVAKILDDRADDHSREIEDARRLRDEAQAMLAEYQRRRQDAAKEAEEIIAMARKEAHVLRRGNTEVPVRAACPPRQVGGREDRPRGSSGDYGDPDRRRWTPLLRAAQNLIAERLSADKAEQLIVSSIAEIQSQA